MKRIDRYILASFFRDYVVSLVVLIGLYVVMDAMFNFDEFAGGAAQGDKSLSQVVLAVLAFYGAQALFVYGQLAGVIPVVAAAFTLMRMSRFNELTALLAAGVPLLRVAAPVVISAAVINIVVQPLNQELLIPRLAGWLTLERNEAAAGDRAAYPVRAMPTGGGGMFDAERFRPASESADARPATAEGVTILERDADGRIAKLTAARAEWDDLRGAWQLTGGVRVSDFIAQTSADELGAAPQSPTIEAVDVWPSTFTPVDIGLYRAGDLSVGAGGSYFDLLQTSQLNALLLRPNRPASADLLRAKHARLSGHVMNLVLMLLAVPAVLTRAPGQLKRAAVKTLLLVGGGMGMIFICQMLARDPPMADVAWAARWPALMCWLPVFVFGPLAVVLLDKMET